MHFTNVLFYSPSWKLSRQMAHGESSSTFPTTSSFLHYLILLFSFKSLNFDFSMQYNPYVHMNETMYKKPQVATFMKITMNSVLHEDLFIQYSSNLYPSTLHPQAHQISKLGPATTRSMLPMLLKYLPCWQDTVNINRGISNQIKVNVALIPMFQI